MMIRRLIFLTIALFGCVAVNAQTMSFADMADLVTLSNAQVELILTQTGKFKVNDRHDQFGEVITTFQTVDRDKKAVRGESMITGDYRTTVDGIKLHTVTYQTIYQEYIDNLMKQIVHFGYRLTFKGIDAKRRFFIYDNQLNHITVLMLNDHSSYSVIIRQKEIGIDQ